MSFVFSGAFPLVFISSVAYEAFRFPFSLSPRSDDRAEESTVYLVTSKQKKRETSYSLFGPRTGWYPPWPPPLCSPLPKAFFRPFHNRSQERATRKKVRKGWAEIEL